MFPTPASSNLQCKPLAIVCDILNSYKWKEDGRFSESWLKAGANEPSMIRTGERYNGRARLDVLNANVKQSQAAKKGGRTVVDDELFEGFKQSLIDNNERQYGAEIRSKYGDDVVDGSNAHLKGLTKEQFSKGEQLRLALEEALKAAFATGDPAGESAQKACDLHRQWLCVFYPRYSKEYHKGLAEMYVHDERFRANYDKLAFGCTEFLRDAINIYCAE